MFILARFSESTGKNNSYISGILSFSRCNFYGYNRDCPGIESLVDDTIVALDVSSFFLFGFIPLANIGFGLNGSDFQRVYKCFKRFQSQKSKLAISSRSEELKSDTI